VGDGTVAAGYVVFAVNPLQAARYRDRHAVSGAKSDTGDGHILADMVRTDAHQLRPVAADTEEAQAVKVVARARKTLISERNRKVTWPQCQLRDFFSPALDAYGGLGLDSADVLELLTKSPDPAAAAKLITAQVSAALKRAHRRHVADKTAVIRAALRAPQLTQADRVTAASAAVVQALTAVIATLNQQIAVLQGQVEAHFLVHPDAEIVLSQPGLGRILGARVLGEFGDDPVCQRQSPQELCGHQPDHPPVRQEENRHGPVRAQRPTPRRTRTAGLLSPDRLARRTRLLRSAPHPRDRARPRAAPARQPPRRHPARLPQNPDSLQRGNRLAPKRQAISPGGLTLLTPGMSPKAERGADAGPAAPQAPP
jgi:hypothetical protein